MYIDYELYARYGAPQTEISLEREFRHQYLGRAARASVTKAKKPQQSHTARAESSAVVALHQVSAGRFFRVI